MCGEQPNAHMVRHDKNAGYRAGKVISLQPGVEKGGPDSFRKKTISNVTHRPIPVVIPLKPGFEDPRPNKYSSHGIDTPKFTRHRMGLVEPPMSREGEVSMGKYGSRDGGTK